MQLDFFEDDEPIQETTEERIKCPKCEEYKHDRDFHKLSKNSLAAKVARRTGSLRFCKVCYNENTLLLYYLKKKHKYPQNPICECCGNKPKHHDKLQLDHCHKTLAFRGWLCRSCNNGLGQLGDNIKGVEEALAYLRKHDEQQS